MKVNHDVARVVLFDDDEVMSNPSWEDFEAKRRNRSTRGASRYRTFLRGLQPGEVRVWELDGSATAEGVRASMLWAAKQEELTDVRTTVVEGAVWVARPPSDQAESPSKPSRPSRKRRLPTKRENPDP